MFSQSEGEGWEKSPTRVLLIGAFNQQKALPSRGLLHDCENPRQAPPVYRAGRAPGPCCTSRSPRASSPCWPSCRPAPAAGPPPDQSQLSWRLLTNHRSPGPAPAWWRPPAPPGRARAATAGGSPAGWPAATGTGSHPAWGEYLDFYTYTHWYLCSCRYVDMLDIWDQKKTQHF